MKKWKRVLIVGMCTLILSFTVMSTYQQANEVKAIIGVDDALILIGLLAAFGIVAGSYVIGSNAEELYDELEEGYDATRFTLLEGGGGNPDDPEDDDDNINDENGDGKVDAKDIPQFSMLMDTYSLNREIKFTASIIACLAPVIYKWYQGKHSNSSGLIEMDTLKQNPDFLSNSYPHFAYFYTWEHGLKPKKIFSYMYLVSPNSVAYFSSDRGAFSFLSPFNNGVKMFSGLDDFIKNENFSLQHLGGLSTKLITLGPVPYEQHIKYTSCVDTNIPIYPDKSSAQEALSKMKEVIWTTPELQDTFKNNGEFKRLPMRDPNKAYDIPTQQALQDLDNDMMDNNLTDEDRNNLVNNFINNLQNPSNKPAPGTQPDSPTNPDPDSPTNPDPDNPTNPDPDNPTNPSGKPDGVGSFLADLKTLFPFCIPFDLIDAFKLLASDSVPPSYTFNISVSSLNIDYDIVVDFTKFEMLVSIFRIMILLMFCIGLILATRGLIKG